MPFVSGTSLSVSVFFFPFVFLIPDIVGHIYGKKVSQLFLRCGFFSVLLFLLFSFISFYLPWSEKSIWAQESYNLLYSVSARISIASLVAFIISGYQDIFIFFLSKRKFLKKGFWFHSLVSNFWGEALDTFIFMTIAFLGIYPFKTILLISVPWWIYKVSMGFLYTPISYTIIQWLNKDNSYEYTSNKN